MRKFFDSWGNLWLECAPGENGARAFGPRGVARPLDPARHGLAHPGKTPYRVAREAGRVLETEDGWSYLK